MVLNRNQSRIMEWLTGEEESGVFQGYNEPENMISDPETMGRIDTFEEKEEFSEPHPRNNLEIVPVSPTVQRIPMQAEEMSVKPSVQFLSEQHILRPMDQNERVIDRTEDLETDEAEKTYLRYKNYSNNLVEEELPEREFRKENIGHSGKAPNFKYRLEKDLHERSKNKSAFKRADK